jgi:hypothetical protein
MKPLVATAQVAVHVYQQEDTHEVPYWRTMLQRFVTVVRVCFEVFRLESFKADECVDL